eukprot:gene16699-biopygen2073
MHGPGALRGGTQSPSKARLCPPQEQVFTDRLVTNVGDDALGVRFESYSPSVENKLRSSERTVSARSAAVYHRVKRAFAHSVHSRAQQGATERVAAPCKSLRNVLVDISVRVFKADFRRSAMLQSVAIALAESTVGLMRSRPWRTPYAAERCRVRGNPTSAVSCRSHANYVACPLTSQHTCDSSHSSADSVTKGGSEPPRAFTARDESGNSRCVKQKSLSCPWRELNAAQAAVALIARKQCGQEP